MGKTNILKNLFVDDKGECIYKEKKGGSRYIQCDDLIVCGYHLISRLPLTSLGYKVLTFSAFLATNSKLLVFCWLTKNFSTSQPS